jgi:two-component system, sporulation sensor kinase D
MLVELTKTKKWKFGLMLGAVAISVFFLFFTNYLVKELSSKEVAEVRKIVHAFEQLNDTSIKNYEETRKTLQAATIPIIVVNEKGKVTNFRNLDSSFVFPTSNKRKVDSSYLNSQLRIMKFFNSPIPIKIDVKINHLVYYKEQRAITLLRYFPYIQLLLIALFLSISYVAFNTSRMNDQNKVWVGMAKETAHQIGTPLSSLMAWVEYLKTTREVPGDDVLEELEKDIKRLEIITERFSKIGSTPELKLYNIFDTVEESIDYLKRRISNKVDIRITPESDLEAEGALNKNLFSWVIENLTKNAVDAMGGKGILIFNIKQGKTNIYIDITDTGKGILRANFQTVFKPGYTTKKRGWGLGLSLSKRIIENYHKGELIVKDSEIGKGTTFRIRLKRPGV